MRPKIITLSLLLAGVVSAQEIPRVQVQTPGVGVQVKTCPTCRPMVYVPRVVYQPYQLGGYTIQQRPTPFRSWLDWRFPRYRVQPYYVPVQPQRQQ